MINKLKKVADKLDSVGLHKEADFIDSVMLKLVKSAQEIERGMNLETGEGETSMRKVLLEACNIFSKKISSLPSLEGANVSPGMFLGSKGSTTNATLYTYGTKVCDLVDKRTSNPDLKEEDYSYKRHACASKSQLDSIVEASLREALQKYGFEDRFDKIGLKPANGGAQVSLKDSNYSGSVEYGFAYNTNLPNHRS